MQLLNSSRGWKAGYGRLFEYNYEFRLLVPLELHKWWPDGRCLALHLTLAGSVIWQLMSAGGSQYWHHLIGSLKCGHMSLGLVQALESICVMSGIASCAACCV